MVEEKGRQTADKKEGRKPWTLREFGGQTVWDWLHLLSALAIPVVLAAAGLWFTAQQDQVQQRIEDDRAQQAQKIEDQRAEAERELAEQRAQDEALQAYLNQMSSLLLERELRASETGTEVRTLARARTLTVLSRLDPSGKTALMQFLEEADLVQRVDSRDPIISLRGADLSGANNLGTFANLRNADLRNANLSDADLEGADLSDADLEGANLSEANLFGVNLSGADLVFADLSNATLRIAYMANADLTGAILSNATLYRAHLSEARLAADLSDADLEGANLSGADLGGRVTASYESPAASLSGADLSGADLSGADLSGSTKKYGDQGIITNEELEQQAASLEGATMPNGQKYEDWLKSKDSRNPGENSTP